MWLTLITYTHAYNGIGPYRKAFSFFFFSLFFNLTSKCKRKKIKQATNDTQEIRLLKNDSDTVASAPFIHHQLLPTKIITNEITLKFLGLN
jgi:hypothetical protein